MSVNRTYRSRLKGPAVSSRGFSMLEMMIAVGILGTALVVILRAHAVNLRMLEYSGRKTTAIMLAENLISEIELMPAPEPGEESGNFEGDFSGFEWRTLIAPLSYDGRVFEDVLRVEVRVSWDEGDVSLTTFISGRR